MGHVKILHMDIHLGTKLYGPYDPLTGASSRLQEFAAALDHTAEVWRGLSGSSLYHVLLAGRRPCPLHCHRLLKESQELGTVCSRCGQDVG